MTDLVSLLFIAMIPIDCKILTLVSLLMFICIYNVMLSISEYVFVVVCLLYIRVLSTFPVVQHFDYYRSGKFSAVRIFCGCLS